MIYVAEVSRNIRLVPPTPWPALMLGGSKLEGRDDVIAHTIGILSTLKDADLVDLKR